MNEKTNMTNSPKEFEFISMTAGGPTRKVRVSIPPPPVSIEQMAEILVKVNHDSSGQLFVAMTDDGVRKILQIAWYLSMLPEEGRYPHLEIFCPATTHPNPHAFGFEPIPFSTAADLRRLSPAANTPGYALLVSERDDGTFDCTGLRNLRADSPIGLSILVMEPGHIRAQYASDTFDLCAGQLRCVSREMHGVPALATMRQELVAKIHNRALQRPAAADGAKLQPAADRAGYVPILKGLQRLFSISTELRHGGAFVILPDAKPGEFDIECKFNVSQPNLYDRFVMNWMGHLILLYSKSRSVDEYETARKQYQRLQKELDADLEAVANLSAVDGCVVMTRDLEVMGFGAGIRVADADVLKSNRLCRLSPETTCSVPEFLSKVGGHRHQSAARLVVKHEKAIAVVVSQDGDLHVFATDPQGCVCKYGPLDASRIM